MLMATSIAIQLLECRFGEVIEEEAQGKNRQRGKRESSPPKRRLPMQ
jgi:hypothetical protein